MANIAALAFGASAKGEKSTQNLFTLIAIHLSEGLRKLTQVLYIWNRCVSLSFCFAIVRFLVREEACQKGQPVVKPVIWI